MILELENKNVFPIILGGSQDLTYGAYLAYEKLKKPVNLVTIDSRIDLSAPGNEFTSQTYLSKIFSGKYLLDFTNIGHQIYFSDHADLDTLKKSFFDFYRLGIVRSALSEMEPVMRDATMISLDVCAIRQSDAPGHFSATPNGFYGEEICTLAMYAGLSDKLSTFGIFEINPDYDINDQTSHLAAQAIWYFLDGFSKKKSEYPREKSREFKEYIVHLNEIDQDLIFYKSNETNRWWIKSPVIKPKPDSPVFISCSYEDYQKASKQEIPDRWWKAYQKYN
jgi:arginase family enzyme